MPTRTIPCTCTSARRMSRLELTAFQGDLKTLPGPQYIQLRELIERWGFMAPVFVWRGRILDGHQRILVLDREDWEVEGGIPVDEIEAADEREAAQKLLAITSAFGKLNPPGLFDYMERWDIGPDVLAAVADLPGLDLEAFAGEYFAPVPAVEDGLLGAGGTTAAEGEMEMVLYGPAEAFTAEVTDRLHKFCQKAGLAIRDDDASRPDRRAYYMWAKKA